MTDQALNIPGQKRTPWPVALTLFVCSSALYIALRSADYNGDMVWQSCMAEGIYPVTFGPDHLLYGPMVRGIWVVWHGLGLPGRAHVALQTVNALFGGIMVATMFLLVFRVTGRRVLAILAAGFFGLMPYVWHHATDVETYGCTKAMQLVAIYLIVLLAEGGDARRRFRLAIAAAVFHALATHMQYLHVMLVPAAIVAALMPGGGVSLATRIRVAAAYLVVVGLLVWVPFLYIGFCVEKVDGASGFVRWLYSPGYGWPVGARMGLVKTPFTWLGGAVSWPTPFGVPLHEGKRVMLGYDKLADYLSAHWWRLALGAVAGLLQAGLVGWFMLSFRRMWERWPRPVIVSFFIIAFYQLFQLYWGGGFIGLALPAYLLMLLLALVDAWAERRKSRFARVLAVGTAAFCAVAAVCSLVFSYVPEHNPKNNLALRETLAASAKLSKDDLMFGTGGDLTSEYWAYFAPDKRRFWLSGNEKASKDAADRLLAKADAAIAAVLASGGKVFVQRLYAEEDDITRPWNELAFFGIDRKTVVEHFKRYPHEKAFECEGRTYWRILAPPEAPTGPARSE